MGLLLSGRLPAATLKNLGGGRDSLAQAGFHCVSRPSHSRKVATQTGKTKTEGRFEEFNALLGSTGHGELADQVVVDESIKFRIVMASVVEVPAFLPIESGVDVIQPARIEPEFSGPQQGDVMGHVAFYTGPRRFPVLADTKC